MPNSDVDRDTETSLLQQIIMSRTFADKLTQTEEIKEEVQQPKIEE